MKFRLSKFHLLCFVSMTFSLYVSSAVINIDRKKEETSTKSCLFKLSDTFTKEQTPVTKHRASVKMLLIQNTINEVLID